jgi:CHAD domain-containing protein
MAFCLKHHHAIGKELYKVARKEFKAALDELDSGTVTEEAIHEARKSLKKIRAELRLLHAKLGSAYATENARLRTAAHLLSSLRDVDAAVETLRGLQHQYQTVLTSSITRTVIRGLRQRKRRVDARASLLVGRATAVLRRSRKSISREIRRAGSVTAVRSGLARGYRRARAAMKDVSMDSGAAQVHLWRRRLKDHWYQVRLFERLHPTARARAETLRRLEGWLGDDHNLDVLRRALLDAPDRFGGARATALVLGCIAKHQPSLRGRALKLGHRMFRAKPVQFRHAVAAWW